MTNYGSGFLGSSSILTSTVNQELVVRGIRYHKFSFFNYAACTISINNSDPIYLAAEQGFSSDFQDANITSFVIIEANINFNWVGAFRNATIYQ